MRVTGATGVVRGPGPTAVFQVPDPAYRLAGVRLCPSVPVAGPLEFFRNGRAWELSIARPAVLRMEYLVELRYPDGHAETRPDPGNPRQVAGAFGPKSVLEFPGYAAPRWLTAPAAVGRTGSVDLPAGSLGAAIAVRTWSPAGAADDEPLPLLLVHDGPEYDTLASLTRYLAAGVTGGWLPRLRAALLSPGPRDPWYSASARYAAALRKIVIPALTSRLATSVRAGLGASLGGLAMLHAHCRYPDAFEGLFLQSGSFFTPRLDPQERQYRYYRRITSFVTGMSAGGLPGRPIPVALTCGTAEENLANNRRMAAVLWEHGYPAVLQEVPDAHNYTAWRDAFDPHLTRLLGQVCR